MKDNVQLKDLRDVLIASLLLILSYPPSPFGFVVCFAFIPLLRLSTGKTPGIMAGLTYLTGLAVNLMVLSWIIPYSFSKYFLLATLNAGQFALLGWWLSWGYRYLSFRNYIFLPFFWTALEHLRGVGDLAFNWMNLSITVTNSAWLVQIADIGGSDLLVFWIMWMNVLIWFIWRSRNRFRPAVAYTTVVGLLVLLPFIYGTWRLQSEEIRPGVRVHIFQPNVNPVIKWQPDYAHRQFREMLRWTCSVQAEAPAQLLVWPETAIPFEIRKFPLYIDQLRYLHAALLTGTLDFTYHEGHRHRYNAVMAVTADTLQLYHKLRPVPFEEVIPYLRCLPWLKDQRIYDRFLSAGKPAPLFQITLRHTAILQKEAVWWRKTDSVHAMESIQIGPSICFETAFQDPAAMHTCAGADMHLMVTNDAWFGFSQQPFQHLSLAVLRAVETRRPVVFCANSGFSAFVDHLGRISGRTGLFKRTVSSGIIPLNRSTSLFIRFGNWVAAVCATVLVFWAGFILYKRYAPGTGPPVKREH